MWFYDVETLEAITNKVPEEKIILAASVKKPKSVKKVYPLNIVKTMIALGFVVILIVLAIYAYQIGWSSGADKILSTVLGLIGGIPLGAFIGETSSVKELKKS